MNLLKRAVPRGLDPIKASFAKEGVVQQLAPLNSLLAEAMKEPYFCDDIERNKQPADIWRGYLTDGEVFVCLDESNNIDGFQALVKIIPNRSAEMVGYLLPDCRRSGKALAYAQELLAYAFGNFGLIKVQAYIGAQNTPALRACEKLGGSLVARIPLNNLFYGTPSDTLLVEFYNPSILAQPEVINVSNEQRTDTPSTEISSTSGLSASPSECTSGDEPDTASAIGDGGDEYAADAIAAF